MTTSLAPPQPAVQKHFTSSILAPPRRNRRTLVASAIHAYDDAATLTYVKNGHALTDPEVT